MVQRILLESVWLLVIAWVVVQFVCVALWSWRRTQATKRLALGGIVALPLLLATSLAVETPREQVVAVCQLLGSGVEEGDVSTIERLLTPGFEAGGLDGGAFIDRLAEKLSRYRVRALSLSRFVIRVDGIDRIVAEFSALCSVRSPDAVYDRVRSRWRLVFHRRGGMWRVAQLESVPVPPLNLRSVDGWLR